MQNVIEIKNLSVNIDKKVIISNISVEIPAGKIIGLLGPSGAGKTTFIRTLLGLQKFHAEGINIFGQKPGAVNLRRKIGYVTQYPSVYPDLSVEENIFYFAKLLGLERSEVNKVMENVELSRYKKQLAGNLSGGQKARVSLAIAMLGNPELMLLDEPTVGLDPILRQRLWDQFRDLSNRGTTIVITSHVMDEADKCDDILFIREGRLLIAGSKEHILRKSKSENIEEAFLKLASGEEKVNES